MELASIAVAMVLGAFLKGVTGMGLPPIAIPVLTPVVGVERAVVIMALPTVVTNTWLAWNNRRAWPETRHLPALLATGAVGGVAGAWALSALDARVLAAAVAALVLAYVAVQLARPRTRLPETVIRFGSPPVGLVAGVLQGATGLSGAVLASWLYAFRLPQKAFVLSVALLFQVFALAQVGGLALFGRYTTGVLAESVLASALVMAVLPVGARWSDRLPRHRFDQLVLAVLVLSAIATLINTFAA